MKKALFMIHIVCVLSSCKNLNDASIYEVDFEHLVRSAFYTQQALLQLHLASNTETETPQYKLLISSYCDLIERGFINNPEKPKQCYPNTNKPSILNKTMHSADKVEKDAKKRHCVAVYHRCFNNCSLKNSECRRCEERGIRCLY